MARRGVKVLMVAAPAMALALALAGCGGDDGGSAGGGAYGVPPATTASTATTGGGTAAATDVTGMSTVPMAMRDDSFAPSALRGTPGQVVTIDLENAGAREHNFAIASQQVDTDVEPGGSATVTVTFPEDGTLRFACEYHEARGMTGALEVPGS